MLCDFWLGQFISLTRLHKLFENAAMLAVTKAALKASHTRSEIKYNIHKYVFLCK